MGNDEGPTTVELTAKKYKIQYVFAVLTFLGGFVVTLLTLTFGNPLIGNPGTPLLMALVVMGIGLAWWIVIKIVIWWHHG